MEKSERTEAKREELTKLLEGLPEVKKRIAGDLIEQAAFLSVTLEDLAESITKNGTVEEYTNGANQSGRKVSSDAKLYSNLIAKYSAIITKLMKIAPDAKTPKPGRVETPESCFSASVEERMKKEEARQARDKKFMELLAAGKVCQEDYKSFSEAEEARQREETEAE